MTPLRTLQAAAIVALAVTVISCNGVQSASNSGGQDTGQISLSASSLDFGNVNVGSSKTLHLMLTNSSSGASSVTVSQLSATGPGFSASNSVPIEIAAGQTADLSVKFNPTSAGAANGSLTIDVVGAADPAQVALAGNGVANANNVLSISPSTMNFGTVNVGSNKKVTGTLSAGSVDLTISSAAWNGQGYTVSGITFPATVRSGKSASFTVTFAPQTTGSSSGSISFMSNATNSPTAVSLVGSGSQASQGHSVRLTWIPPTAVVAGYNIYRGTQSGGPYSRLNSGLRTAPNYTDNTVQSGGAYYYVATSVDSSFNESAFSDEAFATIP